MQKAKLKHWHMTRDNRLAGIVFNHPKFPDGTFVLSSPIMDMHPELNMISTTNTIYTVSDKAPTMETLLCVIQDLIQTQTQVQV